jgi:hypothetical protein
MIFDMAGDPNRRRPSQMTVDDPPIERRVAKDRIRRPGDFRQLPHHLAL